MMPMFHDNPRRAKPLHPVYQAECTRINAAAGRRLRFRECVQ
jgi:hypothetical protein